MFIREVKAFSAALSVSLMWLFLVSPIKNLSGYSVLVDVTTRLNPNDAYLGTYYFWWTNLTYLPTFFFGLTLMVSLLKLKDRLWLASIVSILALIIHATELFDYLSLNSSDNCYLYGTYGINTLLLNGLNRYHPLVFYLSVIYLFVVALGLGSSLKGRLVPFSSLRSVNHLLNNGWVGCLKNLIALWMGSWWALQEGTWGGWWNWDPSETFGLLVTLTLLLTLHSCIQLRRVSALFTKILINFLFFILVYFFIQLNFDLVSHNFGAKFFFFFNNNLFFIEVSQTLMCAVAILVYASYKAWVTASHFSNKIHHLSIKLRLGQIPILSPTLLTLTLVLWSFRPLLNYFLWNFAGINVGNFETPLSPIVASLLIVLATWLIRINWELALAVGYSISSNLNFLALLTLTYSSGNRVHLLHLSLLMFTVLDLISYSLSPTSWIFDSPLMYWVFDLEIGLWGATCLTLDVAGSEFAALWSQAGGESLFSWNVTTTSNIPLNNFFLLNSTALNCFNMYRLGGVYSVAYIAIELPLIPAMNWHFLLGIFTLLTFIGNKPSQIAT